MALFFSDRVQAYWDLSVERWEGEDTAGEANSSEVYIVGPVLRVNWPSRRLFLLVGVQPSYMTHSVIDDDDMGGNIQFTSHLELAWTPLQRLTLGLRGSYFGNVKAFSTGLSSQDKNVKCDATNRCVQTFRGKALFDATLSYAFTESFSLTMGANNIFNTYPDKWKNTRDGDVGQAASYSDGQTPYTRNANQFGFNGSYYFITAGVKF